MTRILTATLLVLGLASAATAHDKLGKDYDGAAPAEKLVLVSIAKADKVLDYKEANAEIEAVCLAELGKGKTTKERLELLGALRSTAQERLKDINAQRREAKAQSVSFVEPSNDLQLAVAMAYIADAAGPVPTLETLGCLALVREATAWVSTGKLVIASALEAFARDEAFMKADTSGKLDVVRVFAGERKLFSDHERTDIEKAIVTDWIAAELKGGKDPNELVKQIDGWKGGGKLCFFTASWASGMLRALAGVPKGQ